MEKYPPSESSYILEMYPYNLGWKGVKKQFQTYSIFVLHYAPYKQWTLYPNFFTYDCELSKINLYFWKTI